LEASTLSLLTSTATGSKCQLSPHLQRLEEAAAVPAMTRVALVGSPRRSLALLQVPAASVSMRVDAAEAAAAAASAERRRPGRGEEEAALRGMK
jgi:coenzyme F420-reducing hydrogenase beta subunit